MEPLAPAIVTEHYGPPGSTPPEPCVWRLSEQFPGRETYPDGLGMIPTGAVLRFVRRLSSAFPPRKVPAGPGGILLSQQAGAAHAALNTEHLPQRWVLRDGEGARRTRLRIVRFLHQK